MTVNEFNAKCHLPSIVTHFGIEPPKLYRKLPLYGWYALSKDEQMTYNCVDLFAAYVPEVPKNNDLALMQACYRYFVNEHPELLEVPIRYSETTENSISRDYYHKKANEKFWRACRAEAFEGNVTYHAKSYKFPKLLEELGMPSFMNAGIGLITPRITYCKEFQPLCLQNKIDSDIVLVPTFYAPNFKIASLETIVLSDLNSRKMIYLDREAGWYGRLGNDIVGGLRDLMTNEGCTWTPKLVPWLNDKVINLHHSLKPNQCIEIWSNHDNIATNKNPLTLIDKKNVAEHIKDNLSHLTLTQIRELEKATGQELKKHWLALKTSEATVSGTKFISNNGRYYYLRGNIPQEYTNFMIELTGIKKVDGEFIQYGQIVMNGDSVSFKTKRKYFVSQYNLIKALTEITLEAGLGVPMVAPNLKHYITNVIDAFNPVNFVEKPKPAVECKVPDNQNVVLDDL